VKVEAFRDRMPLMLCTKSSTPSKNGEPGLRKASKQSTQSTQSTQSKQSKPSKQSKQSKQSQRNKQSKPRNSANRGKGVWELPSLAVTQQSVSLGQKEIPHGTKA